MQARLELYKSIVSIRTLINNSEMCTFLQDSSKY